MRGTYSEEKEVVKLYEGATLVGTHELTGHPVEHLYHDEFTNVIFNREEGELWLQDNGEGSSIQIPLKFI